MRTFYGKLKELHGPNWIILPISDFYEGSDFFRGINYRAYHGDIYRAYHEDIKACLEFLLTADVLQELGAVTE